MQEADEAAGAEMAASGGAQGEAGVENRLLHRVDERVNAVFIINANGIIQMANKNACSLLGYGERGAAGACGLCRRAGWAVACGRRLR